MSKCDVITLACEALSKGQLEESKEIIKVRYRFDMVETKKWNFSKTKLLQVFIRDGFIDRYSGEKLIPTGALSVLSELMPEGRLCLRNWWERLKRREYYWWLPERDKN